MKEYLLGSLNECPYCGGKIKSIYTDLTDRLNTIDVKFKVSECMKCGLAMTNPFVVKGVGGLYPKNYLSVRGSNIKKLNFDKWYRFDQYRFDFDLVKKITGKDISKFDSYLDIGCGSGERIEYAKLQGCKKSFGIDKYDNLNKKVKNIYNSEITSFYPKEKFEVVSMFHVLEHLDNFEQVIKHIKNNILKKNGYLIIQVPNYNCLERVFFKEKWFCFDVPRHIWHFNRKFLVKFFQCEGYKVLGARTSNAFLHPVSIGASLWKEMDIQRIWVLNKPFYYKLLWIFFTVLSIPISFVENLLQKSSMLTIVLNNE